MGTLLLAEVWQLHAGFLPGWQIRVVLWDVLDRVPRARWVLQVSLQGMGVALFGLSTASTPQSEGGPQRALWTCITSIIFVLLELGSGEKFVVQLLRHVQLCDPMKQEKTQMFL